MESADAVVKMAVGELWEFLTWGRLFAYGTLFLVVSFVYDFASQPRYPSEIPMLGHGRGWWAKVRNSVDYFTKHQSWISEGYTKVG